MTQWNNMTQLLHNLPPETVTELYPADSFPIEVRHYLSDWIEEQKWEEFSLENFEKEGQAKALLNHIVAVLEILAEQNTVVMEKIKMTQMSRNLINQQPLGFAVMVRNVLRMERHLIQTHLPLRDPDDRDVDKLVVTVVQIQDLRKGIHYKQEELNWERQTYENIQGSNIGTGIEAKRQEEQLQKKIQQIDHMLRSETRKCIELLCECGEQLEQSQENFLKKLNKWKWDQHKSTIGYQFDDNLNRLQTWCEQLFVVNGNLRQELMLITDQVPNLREKLESLLQTLIISSLVVEKQPPQVIKTQSKFSTTVRYLLGDKVGSGKPVVVKAQIVNELQARSFSSGVSNDNVAELINNSTVLEDNKSTKQSVATFRNMSIKKIRRADRKGSESVTEEKFALLFTTEINITGFDKPCKIQLLSQPLVVIVHGSQEDGALATILWDCAFAEPGRIPFLVPERVPWQMMICTLNAKFKSEVGTEHELDCFNQHFLGQKIFDMPDYTDSFNPMMVSWSQFNKETLRGRVFTFWQWFDAVVDLTKKFLKEYWSNRLIFGFIGKQHTYHILKLCKTGTFMLRFSDSEIGGITIAYVTHENGVPLIHNIQPFTKKDLDISCLADRVRDIEEILYLYPNFPKHDVFKKFYTKKADSRRPDTGYIPFTLQTKVNPEIMAPAGSCSPEDFPVDDLENFGIENIENIPDLPSINIECLPPNNIQAMEPMPIDPPSSLSDPNIPGPSSPFNQFQPAFIPEIPAPSPVYPGLNPPMETEYGMNGSEMLLDALKDL